MPATLKIENELWQNGSEFIAGVDEAGRGPLAGPVVAAAVILPQDFSLQGVNDSKQLSSSKREKLFVLIKQSALAIGISIVNHKIVDKLNIHQANLLAMKLAVEKLEPIPNVLLIDGARFKIKTEIHQINLNKGDQKSVSIAAASIIAKVTRDHLMLALHKKYPEYGFDQHKGYGTKKHYLMLKKYGPCPIHRRSFSLVSSS